MKTILLVDNEQICRESVAAALEVAGYRVLQAADGAVALTMVESEAPDLILLDIVMPVVDGLTCLRQLRSRPETANTPVLILTALSDREKVSAAATLGVVAYVLKSRFSLGALRSRIAEVLACPDQRPHVGYRDFAALRQDERDPEQAAAPLQAVPMPSTSVRPLLTRQQALERQRAALRGATPSSLILRVLQLCEDSRADLGELTRLVAADASLTAGVYRTASAAANGFTSAPQTLSAAISRIGTAGVRRLATACGMLRIGQNVRHGPFDFMRTWRHCFAVAQVASLLTERLDGILSRNAYLAGLCYDLPDVLFRATFSREYQQIAKAAQERGVPVESLESQMLGLTRREFTDAVLAQLNLPEAARVAVQLLSTNDDTVMHPVAEVVRLARAYVTGLGFASHRPLLVGPVSRAHCQNILGTAHPRLRPPAQLREYLSHTATALVTDTRSEKTVAPAAYEREMIHVEHRPLRIWYSRDAGFSSFDPLEHAMALRAQVHVTEAVPLPSMLEEYDGLVLACTGRSTLVTQARAARAAAQVRPTLVGLTGPARESDDGVEPPVSLPLPLEELDAFLVRVRDEAAVQANLVSVA